MRDFTPKQGTTCCEGTGMESATKYQDSVYFRAADDSALYVNLFSPTMLDWGSKGVTITQATAYPVEQGTTLTVRGSAAFDLKVRVPSWVQAGFEVTVNGQVQAVEATPGTYLTLSRSWADGDTVAISMPFTLRTEKALDNPRSRPSSTVRSTWWPVTRGRPTSTSRCRCTRTCRETWGGLVPCRAKTCTSGSATCTSRPSTRGPPTRSTPTSAAPSRASRSRVPTRVTNVTRTGGSRSSTRSGLPPRSSPRRPSSSTSGRCPRRGRPTVCSRAPRGRRSCSPPRRRGTDRAR
ncbi:hypothetical protein NKG05_06415 [Oerskovia sp. M15]